MNAGDPVRSLASDLRNASRGVGARTAQVVRHTAAAIERDARLAAPVDTGNLRSSISTSTTGDPRSGAMRAEIGPTAHYGIYVETGTSRMAAQPYLFPAADRHEPAFLKALEQAVDPKL